MEAAVGGPGSAQLSIYTRVSNHSEWVGVRARHRQWGAETGGCNAEWRPLPRSHNHRYRLGYVCTGSQTHPASPPQAVYWLRSSGRRCCWVSGHRRATLACSIWRLAWWTFHSENTKMQEKKIPRRNLRRSDGPMTDQTHLFGLGRRRAAGRGHGRRTQSGVLLCRATLIQAVLPGRVGGASSGGRRVLG